MADKIIQLKDGNDNVYPIGIVQGGGGTSTIDYDVVSTTDDSVVMGDNVVEQGTTTNTSGTWTYRKWESGIAECWLMVQLPETYKFDDGTTSQGLKYKADSVLFPSFFTSVPQSVLAQAGNLSGVFIDIHRITQTGAELYFICISEGIAAGSYTFVSYYVIGTWK